MGYTMMGCLKDIFLSFSLSVSSINVVFCYSLGADPSQLASVALTRLQAELAKDGRDPAGASSFKVPEKSPAGTGRSAFSKSLNKKKGEESLLY